MANKTKKQTTSAAAKAAADMAAPGSEKQVSVIQLSDLEKIKQARSLTGLDPNHTVDLLSMLNERFYRDPEAAKKYNMSKDAVDNINSITAVGMVAVLADEVSHSQTTFAIAMRKSQLEAIKEAAVALGVTFNEKMLPEPDEKDVIEVPSTAIEVSKETKAAIEHEKNISAKTVVLDPTKIENEEQLKDSLLSLLVKGNGDSNFYNKVMTAINFYEAYCKVKANAAENKEEELKKLKEKTRCDFLTEIANLLGRCTFTVGGMAKILYEQTERTKNPVTAFCMFRNASLNQKTGMPQIEDAAIADIVKVLIRWYANSCIIDTNKCIEGFEKCLEVLKKDPKKNAKAISQGNLKIENAKKHLSDIEAVVSYANVPDSSLIDEFENNYTNDSSEGYKYARMMGAKIMDTYYPGVKASAVETKSLIHNLKQYVGVIFNMFLPTTQQNVNYSEANISELKMLDASEETPKNE